MRDISTLRRSRDNRMVAGVAEGLSRHFDIDPIIIRVLFGALTLFGGAGLLIYLIAWATVPEEGNHHSGVSSLLRRDPDRVMIAGLSIAAAVGAITMFTTIGWSSPNPFGVVTVGVLALVAIAVLSRRRDQKPPPPPWTPPAPWTIPAAGPGAPPAPPAAPQPSPSPSPTDEDATTPIEPAEPRAWWQRNEAPGAPAGPTPPTAYAPVPPPPPMPPRQPRSHLFALTMAVIAIAIGGLWLVDVTVVDDMAVSIYPATVLAITAVALLISTWYGRSRLLILVGILASLATSIAAALGPGPIGDRVYEPPSAASLHSEYEHGTGRVVLNLSELTDTENLDGRTVHVDSRIGQLQVVIPSSISVHIDAHVDHGEIDGPRRSVISQENDGGESTVISSVGSTGTADLYLDLDLKFGQILITRYDCGTPGPFETRYDLLTDSTRGGSNAAPACN